MESSKIYCNTISELEFMFGMIATPLPKFVGVYLFCHHQYPNRKSKKIAIRLCCADVECFDVYEFDKELDYVNIKGQYPNSIGPALIKNIETIFPDVERFVSSSKSLHNIPEK